jgi:hypothetical protein
MREEEIRELNHLEAQMISGLDDLMNIWSFSNAMKIMNEVVLTLERAGFINEENKTDVISILYRFGNRIRDLTLDSNYVYTIRSQLQRYLDNDRKSLEEEQ